MNNTTSGRTLRLPVVFVVALILGVVIIIGYELVRVDAFWRKLPHSPAAAVYLALASVMFATLVVIVVAVIREVRRANRPEMTGYREAVETGRISGDVSRWPDWIRHDRKVNVFRAMGAAGFALLGVTSIVGGPWWQAFVFFSVALLNGWEAWRTHRRLSALHESLSASRPPALP